MIQKQSCYKNLFEKRVWKIKQNIDKIHSTLNTANVTLIFFQQNNIYIFQFTSVYIDVQMYSAYKNKNIKKIAQNCYFRLYSLIEHNIE